MSDRGQPQIQMPFSGFAANRGAFGGPNTGAQFSPFVSGFFRRRQGIWPTQQGNLPQVNAGYFPYDPNTPGGVPYSPGSATPPSDLRLLEGKGPLENQVTPQPVSTATPTRNIYQNYPGFNPLNVPKSGDQTDINRNMAGGMPGQLQQLSQGAMGFFGRGFGSRPMGMGLGYGDTSSLEGLLKRLLEARGGTY